MDSNTDEKIKALRESILSQEKVVAFPGIEVTEPAIPMESVPVEGPPPVPVAMDQMLGVLNKKQIPYTIIFMTSKDGNPVVNFATTMGGEHIVPFLHHVIDANAERFGE